MMKNLALAAVLVLSAAPAAAAPGDAADAKALLMRGVGFDTVKGRGRTPAYAADLKAYLVAAGFAPGDIAIDELHGTANLHLLWRGAGKKPPIALTAHMDVVEADAKDWTRDPFVAVEDGGYIFGRGVLDNKFDLSMLVATLARLKSQGFKPGRDIHLFLSGDEETDGFTAEVQAKAAKAAGVVFMLNTDAGGGGLDEAGRPSGYQVQAAEKSYADFTMTVTNAGGHSSTPGASNAIAELGAAAAKVAGYRFAPQINDITRASLADQAGRRSDAIGGAIKAFLADPSDPAALAVLRADPGSIGQIGTTCVPTQVQGGHAPNALPQRATMNVNCRIFPGISVEDTLLELARLVGAGVAVTSQMEWKSTPASPLRPDVMGAITKAVTARVPGLLPVPGMSAGATDSVYYRALGIPSYGAGSLFMKDSDFFAHGLNERVPAAEIAPALRHWEIILKDVAR
ncbi:M20/M25/M40 family metallo-hydrolase [Sandarakinorhabdus sp.]|uniref:M20/M25/M40 family metallo-hydrolase n=1 Tax=Sandarakinorhabdus sp. TaxID=1916663 RepID=UPI00286E950B|nr:M20/M25/M40 family metallo-hydrolase [Sandarakinorhabdus sp.]